VKILSHIIVEDSAESISLVLKVMERLFSKLSRFFLYSFVDLNHILNLSEPLARKKDPRRSSGVVGSKGTKAPTAPIEIDINPSDI
jgi:hypothetical protein